MALAAERGVADHVRWVDEFVEHRRLLDFLEAADIYVTPYLGAQQMTSGTLAYAVGMGKPVVSTPYVHAAELLPGGHGRLVSFGDADGFADEIDGLLADPDERERMAPRQSCARPHDDLAAPRRSDRRGDDRGGGRAGVAPGRGAPGPAGARLVRRGRPAQRRYRHAPAQRSFGVPDRAHGYCIDDNARALMLMQRCRRSAGSALRPLDAGLCRLRPACLEPGGGPLPQLHGASTGPGCEEAGSDDSSARALWSLGVTARDGRSAELRDWAAALFERDRDLTRSSSTRPALARLRDARRRGAGRGAAGRCAGDAAARRARRGAGRRAGGRAPPGLDLVRALPLL